MSPVQARRLTEEWLGVPLGSGPVNRVSGDCPVARGLRKSRGGRWRVGWHSYLGSSQPAMDLPECAQQFIRYWHDDEYPDLVDE